MKLFPFFEEGVELSHTLKGELLHQVDELRVGHIPLLETADCNWVGG